MKIVLELYHQNCHYSIFLTHLVFIMTDIDIGSCSDDDGFIFAYNCDYFMKSSVIFRLLHFNGFIII